MIDKFKLGDQVIYIPVTGEIIESQIGKVIKIDNRYVYVKFKYGTVHQILPDSVHHYPLPNEFEIEI